MARRGHGLRGHVAGRVHHAVHHGLHQHGAFGRLSMALGLGILGFGWLFFFLLEGGFCYELLVAFYGVFSWFGVWILF